MVRWLHISDLHIRKEADWINFKTELMNKCRMIGKINLVIVTGDFHNFSDKNNFELAKDFLNQLIQNLGLDINKDLFVIPGNHDGVTMIKEKEAFVTAAMAKPVSLERSWVEILLGAFNDYETFIRELIPDYPVDFPAQVHHRVWNEQLNFIHCNTAIASNGKQKDGQIMDIDKLASVEFRTDIPNIILAHNSFFDLHIEQQKRIKDIIRIYPVCAFLCGDKHIEQVKQITYEPNQNRQVPCVVSYKSSPEAIDDYSEFGMIIGEWEDGERKAYLKGWTWKSGRGFEVDATITEQEIDMTGRIVISQDTVRNSENIAEMCETQRDFEGESKEIQSESSLKRSFVKLYYNMTPAQIENFNRKFTVEQYTLKTRMQSKELFAYIADAVKNGMLNEMVFYMAELFK